MGGSQSKEEKSCFILEVILFVSDSSTRSAYVKEKALGQGEWLSLEE